ncbi:tail fiber assembly protein [Pantoea eucrina]|uniref:tail fiber assembly protein n=1 Tax=Pantoea eucrina TaxID=472693 RepID=UPI0024B7B515|nr:tail fiber assembly protein [Pantoea eucrina]MDJ0023670.1 tail fiber assembly protein [Pantoea eucrina]
MIFSEFTGYTPDMPVIGEDATDEEKAHFEHMKILLSHNVVFARDANNVCWYEAQKHFAEHTIKLMLCAGGRIWALDKDASRMWPEGYSVAEVDESLVPDDIQPNGEWAYKNGVIAPRALLQEEITERFNKQRDRLLNEARAVITEWQAELSLDILPDNEKALLVRWLSYIRALKGMELGPVDSAAWPEVPPTS